VATAGGAKLWAFGTGAAVRATPVVADGAVYVSSADGAIYGLDARTGAKLWTAQTKNRIISAPVVVDGVVYAGSADNGVYALDARTGKPAWTFYALAGSRAYLTPRGRWGRLHPTWSLGSSTPRRGWALGRLTPWTRVVGSCCGASTRRVRPWCR